MYRIGNEERMLIEEYGEEYQKQTWKLFPYIY
jgi:protein-S-isoprenylcysteine O-methyltransferase Ste14